MVQLARHRSIPAAAQEHVNTQDTNQTESTNF